MPKLHVELSSSGIALPLLFVNEVAEEQQTLGKTCGDLVGYKAIATYELRSAAGSRWAALERWCKLL